MKCMAISLRADESFEGWRECMSVDILPYTSRWGLPYKFGGEKEKKKKKKIWSPIKSVILR